MSCFRDNSDPENIDQIPRVDMQLFDNMYLLNKFEQLLNPMALSGSKLLWSFCKLHPNRTPPDYKDMVLIRWNQMDLESKFPPRKSILEDRERREN
jgi:hypothetical protein